MLHLETLRGDHDRISTSSPFLNFTAGIYLRQQTAPMLIGGTRERQNAVYSYPSQGYERNTEFTTSHVKVN